MTKFAFNPDLDLAQLASRYVEDPRLQIGSFLNEEAAKALLTQMKVSEEWRLTANRGDQVIDFDREKLAKFTPEHWAKLQKAVVLGGRYGFQFCYETIRLPKRGEVRTPAPLLKAFVDFLSSPEMIGFMRTLTGASDIAFADGHASRYRAHHFLSSHDDHQENMGRRAAYVLNLTPEWRPDWGGLLLFYDELGNVVRGFTPGFNILNIFAVPQAHSVSWVTPLAPHPRYAVTGWLRAGEPG